MLDAAFAALLDLIREHGPLLLFVAAFLENAAFISWLVPGEKLVAVGGFFIQRGELRFEEAWLYVFLGVLCGDHVAYAIGRIAGKRVVHRLPYPRLIARVEWLIGRHGCWVVLFGRYFGAMRSVVLFTVGTMGLPYRQFWLFELLGAASWSLVWLGVGVLGGTVLEAFGFAEGDLGWWGPVLWAGLVGIIAVVIWRYQDRLKRLVLGEDEPSDRAPQTVG